MSILLSKAQIIEEVVQLLQGDDNDLLAEIYSLVSHGKTVQPQAPDSFQVTDCEPIIDMFNIEAAFNMFNSETYMDEQGRPIIPCLFGRARETLDHLEKGVFDAYWRAQTRTVNALFTKRKLTLQDMIFDPLNEEEIEIRADEAGYVSGLVFVNLSEMINIDDLNDIVEGKMIETGTLSDISYENLFITRDLVLLLVTAQVIEY